MFSWIPVLGPIIEGIVSIFKQETDVQLATVQDNNKTDVAVIQSRTQLAIATKDDLGIMIIRDLIMFPVACYTGLIFWDSIFMHLYPELTWTIAAIPTNLDYIPYAVIAFLFVTAWRK